MKHLIKLRTAQKSDDPFIFSLSPYLAEVAQLSWHTEDVINKMQYDYIAEMLKETSVPHITYIAEIDNTPSGFIHIRTQHDSISGEAVATIPLLAVSPKYQSMGIANRLINKAVEWGKAQGCRLLHLEVFANNKNAQGFYEHNGFEAEMIEMVKVI
jgi:ribosomal protein S18 acetylase RimI-like enzyme